MKKSKLLFKIFIVLCFNASAQIEFETHLLAEDQNAPNDVLACDIDGDGDLDIVATVTSHDKILWFENTDGQGNYSEPIILADNFNGAYAIFAVDLDGDDDLDMLSTARDGNKFSWFENTDGMGSFGPEIIIDDNAEATSIFSADFDADGDMDAVIASFGGNEIIWYENTDGFGNFSEGIVIAIQDGIHSVYAVDIDGDSDLDICTASAFDNTVAWYENIDGLGTFELGAIISSEIEGAARVFSEDFDGDGDPDVLVSAYFGDELVWFENTDGLGNFGSKNIIGEEIGMWGIHANDIDSDGDMDVIASWATPDAGEILWYENTDGQGVFGPKQTVSLDCTDCGYIYSGDFDGDTDIDVIAALWVDDKISWYENSLILGDVDFDSSNVSVYPIPTKGMLYVDSQSTIVTLKVYNLFGQLIKENTHKEEIDLRQLSQGVYMLYMEDSLGEKTTTKISKN